MSYINIAKAGIAAAVICCLVQCSPKPAMTAEPASAAPAAAASPYGYDVKLTFEPDVTAKFKAEGMKVILGNEFYGQANPAAVAAKKGGAGGELEMGQENFTVDAVDQTIHVTGNNLKTDVLADSVDNAANVLINVQPDTTKNPDSVLNCPDTYQGKVAGAQAKLVEIHCYLPPQ